MRVSWVPRRKRILRGGTALLWLLLFAGGRDCRGLRQFRGRGVAVGCRGRRSGLEVRYEMEFWKSTEMMMRMGMGIGGLYPL